MATHTTSQRKGELLGAVIAIKGTSVKIHVLDHTLSYAQNQREVTHVHDTTAASSDTEPMFVASSEVRAYLRARGHATGKKTEILAVMKAKTALAVRVSLGRFICEGSFLLADASYRTSKKSRFVSVSCGGVLTSSKTEERR